MVASFKDIAAAMTRCVAIIEDYARLAPSTLTTSAALAAVTDGAHGETLATASGKKQRAKKEKKPKDPNAPKRPPSAYLLFQNDVRENIRTANPTLPYKEILGVIASRWKELDEPQRKVYELAYNDATSHFRQAEEAYKNGLPMPALPASLVGRIGGVAGSNVAGIVSEDEEEEEDEDEDSEEGTVSGLMDLVGD